MKRILSLVLIACLLLAQTACAHAAVDRDREGTPVVLPEKIEKVISFGPSNTEIVSALGVAEKLVAIDTYSENVEGIPAGLPMFDMMMPDAEKILALTPDVLFVTGMSKADSEDPFKPVRDAGVCVLYIPTSESIEGIKEDIRFVAAVMGQEEKGAEMIGQMEADISAVKAIGDTITEKKSVYFEISAAPYMYSFGSGVFLNELIELAGATNILADQSAWVSVTDESVLAANPDVILTSVNYIDNPVDEIKARPGWDVLSAVVNDRVYAVDTDASSRPNHNIVKALFEIASSVYPEAYQSLQR